MLSTGRYFMFFMIVVLSVLFIGCQSASQKQPETGQLPVQKNVIYFIGDGMGFNQVLTANY